MKLMYNYIKTNKTNKQIQLKTLPRHPNKH